MGRDVTHMPHAEVSGLQLRVQSSGDDHPAVFDPPDERSVDALGIADRAQCVRRNGIARRLFWLSYVYLGH